MPYHPFSLLSLLSLLLLVNLLSQPTLTANLTPSSPNLVSNSTRDSVLLRSIPSLNFSANIRTVSKNGSRHRQLRCIGGSASNFWGLANYHPHHAQCRNIALQSQNVQWSCTGDLNTLVHFGPRTDVHCEPYHQEIDDGYVLKGSCRLDYTVDFNNFHFTYVHFAYGLFLPLILSSLWLLTRQLRC